MTFLTNVSRADQFITVNPLRTVDNSNQTGKVSPVDYLNQTGNLAQSILWDLDLLARFSSSSLAFSSLDNAIETNSEAVQLNNRNPTADEVSALSLQDAIMAIADDLLTYQGILAVARKDGESNAQHIERHFAAIKFGQTKFHIAQLVINSVLCVIYIYEVCRTRYWKNMPDFNFVDVKALTLAALGPERSLNRSDVNLTPSTSHSVSRRKAQDENTRLMAFYDERSKTRLRYADNAESRLHHLSNLSIGRTTSVDEGYLHPSGGLGMSGSGGFVSRDPFGRVSSYTSLNPLLGDL